MIPGKMRKTGPQCGDEGQIPNLRTLTVHRQAMEKLDRATASGADLPRRAFLRRLCALGVGTVLPVAEVVGGVRSMTAGETKYPGPDDSGSLRLFLCGDVMTGRGVDQILPHPVGTELYESHVRDAREYVALAEQASGRIPRPVPFDYVWGDALTVLADADPHARIVNLETAVTAHAVPWPDKGINYRMHPANTPVLTALGADVCVLANNHVLDWRTPGLRETLKTLRAAGIGTAGAGGNRDEAEQPAVIEAGGRRLLVFGFGIASSGIPDAWAAGTTSPGLNFLPDLSPDSLAAAVRTIRAHARPGDRVLASIHWGDNWGYAIAEDRRGFARGLIDRAGVDIVHGHSSHHPQGIEVHRERLILYGCGDFLNDYEGISGYERFRPDLRLMYLPALDPESGRLRRLTLAPLQIHRMRLRHATETDARWLAETLTRHSATLGAGIGIDPETPGERGYITLAVRWGDGRRGAGHHGYR